MGGKRTILLMVLMSCFMGTILALHTRANAKFAGAREAISTIATCGTLRLGMSREDVLRVMGAPSREYQTEGPSGAVALALKFELPIKEDRFPLVVLESDHLVEAVCTEQHRLTATPAEIAAMLAKDAEQVQTIGSDIQRR